jgi:aspartyl/asparaginyl-tRNA synthetase
VTENSNTSRYLSEFWMIEPEIAFADLTDNTTLAEGLLKYTFAALLKEREEDLTFFDQRVEKGLVAKLEGIVGSEFVHWITARRSVRSSGRTRSSNFRSTSATRSPSREPRKRAVLKRRSVGQAERGLVHEL